MAKRIINRKENRLPMSDDDFETNLHVDEEISERETSEEKSEKKPKKKTRKRAEPAPTKEVRLKAFWAVYSQSFQRVKLFEYGEKEAAEKFAAELSETKKIPHYVRMEKLVME
ncbi:MAG: hypothetical protein Q4D38_04240 [Planctomycetia bacterium]|nr:hypothetical protein [Planctomycetia bacterium]